MLFKTISEIKTFLPVGAGNDYGRLKPHIENAEQKYIKPLLGTNMYEELEEFYDAAYPEDPTEVQEATKKLLEKVQHALIHLAYFVGFDFLNIQATDAGFHRSESQTQKGLYKYQEDNLREYFQQSGLNGLDDVLVFLENNIAHFGEFKASNNWTELKESFLPTVAVIEKIPYNLHGSRLIFLALKPHVSFAEDTDIKPLLGTTIYNTIKTEMVKDAPAEKVTNILPYIRKPLIYLAAANLMEETGATLYDKGLYFEEKTGLYPGNTKKAPAEAEIAAKRVAGQRLKASIYLEALKKYLNDNIDEWEDYSGQTGSLFNRDNTDKKTFWS